MSEKTSDEGRNEALSESAAHEVGLLHAELTNPAVVVMVFKSSVTSIAFAAAS